MSSDHSHAVVEGQNEKPLWIALALTSSFLIAEVIGGILTNSLALISDAAHMFTDAAALAVSLAAIRIGRRPADSKRTFGYYRFEILAAAFNAILLFLVAMYIIFEAYGRFKNPPEIQSGMMLAIASFGLVINLISMRLLTSGKDKSLNVKGAYLEVWSDMLGSLGVIVGAILIWSTGWAWVDSIIAVGIGIWVLPRTWTLLKESVNVLLEGVPHGLGVDQINAALGGLDGVTGTHELHVWSLSSGKNSLTAHLVTSLDPSQWPLLLSQARAVLGEKFDIHHVTLQLESVACGQAGVAHNYSPLPLADGHSEPDAVEVPASRGV